jgi:hypothetical protein
VPRALHHLDLWVDDVATAEGEWGWLLARCGWQREEGILSWVHHLATTVGTRDELDRMRSESTEHRWHELYADRYPHAGGQEHVALYLESSEGFEVEVVLGD